MLSTPRYWYHSYCCSYCRLFVELSYWKGKIIVAVEWINNEAIAVVSLATIREIVRSYNSEEKANKEKTGKTKWTILSMDEQKYIWIEVELKPSLPR